MVERASSRSGEDVVSVVVSRVIESSGRGLARAQPQRRRVTADRAEIGGTQRGDMESAVTAHGLSADRYAAWRRTEAANGVRDRLAKNHRGPPSIPPIVVVAMAAAVQEDDDRRTRAETSEASEEPVTQHRLWPRLRPDEP